MDILYLSLERLFQLTTICSDRLLLNVLGSFENTHQLVLDSKKHPSGLWCVDKFLKEPTCHRINKVRVIVAFAYLNGFFQFEDGIITFGDMNVLCELLKRNCILQEEYNAFVHIIYEARYENIPFKFDLYEEKTNAPE